MIRINRLRTVCPFTVVAAYCLLIFGCQKPEDVNCVKLSEQVKGDAVICTDGGEPQVCMSPDLDHCGYSVKSMYIPCKSCYDCDNATDITVALCSGRQ
jgi:hypothetical protein